MPACAKGFKSCKFKGARGQWIAHCARCGRRSADADWKLGIKPRRQPRERRVIAPRIGVAFSLLCGLDWVAGWTVTKVTRATVFFRHCDYDGTALYSRSMRIAEWTILQSGGKLIVRSRGEAA
jgi:hypothetical protein